MLGGLQLDEAECLWPVLQADSVTGIAAMLKPHLNAEFQQLVEAHGRAGEAFPTLRAGAKRIWTQQAALPARAKRRRTALLVHQVLEQQAADIALLDGALSRFQALVQAEENATDDVKRGMKALLDRLVGIAEQAKLSHHAAVRRNVGGG